jgi:hypothetical protein
MSGQATEYDVGGSTPFSRRFVEQPFDRAFFLARHVRRESDTGPQPLQLYLRRYFYGSNLGLAQALGFGINRFFGNMSFIIGHECRTASGNQWDVGTIRMRAGYPPVSPATRATIPGILLRSRCSEHRTTIWCLSPSASLGSPAILTGPSAVATPGWYGLTIHCQMDGDGHQDS